MERKVFISVVNPILDSHTSATIDDPVNEEQRVVNALKYFGITDVDWVKTFIDTHVPNKKEYLTTKMGTVRDTCKIVTVSYYTEPLPF